MSPIVRPRVLIFDDQTLDAEEYERLLEPEFEVVGTTANEQDLLAAVPQVKPDVIVLDLGTPWMNGLVTVKRIKKLLRTVRIVYLTMNADTSIKPEELRSGASGYVPRSSAAAELVSAVRDVLRGERYISPSILPNVESLPPENMDTRMGQEELTNRQREVLKLLAEGRTMKEIAYILILTPRTVAFHKYKIMERFHLRTNAELVQFAIQERVITPGP